MHGCLIFSNYHDVAYQIRHHKTRGNLFWRFPSFLSDLSFYPTMTILEDISSEWAWFVQEGHHPSHSVLPVDGKPSGHTSAPVPNSSNPTAGAIATIEDTRTIPFRRFSFQQFFNFPLHFLHQTRTHNNISPLFLQNDVHLFRKPCPMHHPSEWTLLLSHIPCPSLMLFYFSM